MDIGTFEKAQKIVQNLKELENEHGDIQDALSNGITELTITTNLGEVEIVDSERISKLAFIIDTFYWEEDKRMKALLDEI